MLTRKQFFNRSLIFPVALSAVGCGGASSNLSQEEVSSTNYPDPPLLASRDVWNRIRLFHADTTRANQPILLRNVVGFEGALPTEVNPMVENIAYGSDGVSSNIALPAYGRMQVLSATTGETIYEIGNASSYGGLATAIVYPKAQVNDIRAGITSINAFVPYSRPPETGKSIVKFVNVSSDSRATNSIVLVNKVASLSAITFGNAEQQSVAWGENSVQVLSATNPAEVLLDTVLSVSPDNHLYTAVFYGGTDGQPFALRLLTDL